LAATLVTASPGLRIPTITENAPRAVQMTGRDHHSPLPDKPADQNHSPGPAHKLATATETQAPPDLSHHQSDQSRPEHLPLIRITTPGHGGAAGSRGGVGMTPPSGRGAGLSQYLGGSVPIAGQAVSVSAQRCADWDRRPWEVPGQPRPRRQGRKPRSTIVPTGLEAVSVGGRVPGIMVVGGSRWRENGCGRCPAACKRL
jgi:hypothetical protein